MLVPQYFKPVLQYFNPISHGPFFEPSVISGGGRGVMRARHHHFVVIAPMIMKFGTSINHDVFYTMVTKTFVMSLLLRNYDIITCILADA